jgi:ATP-dependent DNA ligase
VRSRPGHDRPLAFPELSRLRDALARRNVLLDGEVVVFGRRGRPDFAAVRGRLCGASAKAARRGRSSCGVCFASTPRATRGLALTDRQALLAELLEPRVEGMARRGAARRAARSRARRDR